MKKKLVRYLLDRIFAHTVCFLRICKYATDKKYLNIWLEAKQNIEIYILWDLQIDKICLVTITQIFSKQDTISYFLESFLDMLFKFKNNLFLYKRVSKPPSGPKFTSFLCRSMNRNTAEDGCVSDTFGRRLK